MTFLAVFALAIAALVAAPYAAHRLRRQQAEERPFAPVRLVPPTPPKARRRARLEDRGLFAVRALSILALALLGASPLVRCSRVALSRSGTSVAVAIVVDDSMSMRAVDASGRSRFRLAQQGAREILGALRDGDAAAIVMAGSPARVGLAATTDIAAARSALDGMTESDRATDLEGAIAIARTLVAELPQIDRRVVLLSDLADGNPDAPPLGEGSAAALWAAMPELASSADDCGVISADRFASSVRVRFACTGSAAPGRDVQVLDGDKVIARAPLPQSQTGEAILTVVADDDKSLVAQLSGVDAISSDNRAPVVVETGPAALAVVGDRTEEAVATGGAPLIEQALRALHVDMAVRPLPQVPDRREETAPFAGIVVDDPPGFTPEQRRALSAFVESGGVLMVALGRRSSAAPLGATLEPLLTQAVAWNAAAAGGVDVASGTSLFGEATSSLADLAPKGHVTLKDQDGSAYESLLKWGDGSPLVARRTLGRGALWLTTLPFSVEISDFALRPGFLALLDAVVGEAKERSTPRRGDVGVPWVFSGARSAVAEGPQGPLVVTREAGVLRFVPPVVGGYQITIDGAKELRVAAPVAREIDFRPRAVAPGARSSALGGAVMNVDVSWIVALVLLGLVAAELALRALSRTRATEQVR